MGRCLEGMAWFWPVALGFGGASFPEIRSLAGLWPGGSCQGKSVSRSQTLGVGNCGQVAPKREKEKKKVKGYNFGRVHAQPSAGMGPEWPHLHSEFNHHLTRYFSPNSKIRKPPAPVPACLLACDRGRACLNFDPTSFTSSRTVSFLRLDILLTSATSSFDSRLLPCLT